MTKNDCLFERNKPKTAADASIKYAQGKQRKLFSKAGYVICDRPEDAVNVLGKLSPESVLGVIIMVAA